MFPATVAVKEGDFEFSFQGKLPIPRDAAREFKTKKDEGKLCLSYSNKVVKMVHEGKSIKRYCGLNGLALLFGNTEHPLSGEFALPEYLRGSAEWKTIEQKRLEPVY
jgi:hypothetical protein